MAMKNIACEQNNVYQQLTLCWKTYSHLSVIFYKTLNNHYGNETNDLERSLF